MILNAWRNIIRNVLAGDAETMPTHTALGDGNTAAAGTDTILDNETARKAITTTSKPADYVVRHETIWGSAEENGNSFCEAGIINAASVGVLANRIVFPSFEKQDTFELRVQTDFKINEV